MQTAEMQRRLEVERLHSFAELQALGDAFHGDLIEGRLVPVSPTTKLHMVTCSNLTFELERWARSLGRRFRVLSGEGGYVVQRNPDTVLAADVAVVTAERLEAAADTFLEGAPEVAIEVLSAGNTMGETERKLCLYFAGGARSVWLVDPEARLVTLYRSLREREIFRESDSLIDPALPGFTVEVGSLFR
jgi:Uma2 family endonuclease